MSVKRCVAFLSVLLSLSLCAQEICDNGIDDDGNGLIDLNDPACPCATILVGDSVASYIRNHSFEDRLCCPTSFVSMFSPPYLSCAAGWHQATTATADYFHECAYSPAGFNLPPPDGDGAVGFFAFPGYFEYVGTCLTYPAPAHPLQAGVTYTLSLWISTAVVNGTHSQPLSHADPSYFTEQFPLALFGYAEACVEFPIPTMDCIGYMPGWNELGRVYVQPAFEWTRVSITFTPTENIHSVLIGGACDVPASLDERIITNAAGETYTGTPYYQIDELKLTLAGDQILSSVSTSGTICAGTALATGTPPAIASAHQWYLDGVAVVGQTGPSLDVAGLGLDGGTYTLASRINGECLMASSYIPRAIHPTPWPFVAPARGCVPLLVSFSDTTSGATTVRWDLGNGSTRADSAFEYTYSVPGTYDVRLSVINSAGCSSDTVLLGGVVVHPAVVADIVITPNPTTVEEPVVALTGAGSTGDVVAWWWDLGAVEPFVSTATDLSVVFPAVPGEYPVLLAVESGNGCVDTVRSIVVVLDKGSIVMPNVFSPNGDGQNDRFVPLDYNGTPALLEVYNRWGQLLFSTRSLAQGWTGQDAPDGTYFYVVTPDDPELGRLSGHVTLLR